MPRAEPFTRLVEFVRTERGGAVAALCSGTWDSEAEARALVGKISALDAIIEEMRTISGPGTHFGEEDLA